MEWKKRDNCKSIQEVCLRNLGVSNTDEINAWFIKSRGLEYKIPKMKRAKEVLCLFKEKPVIICGDYDCDGVMATSICYMLLKELGFQTVEYMIPRRHSEGYGLNIRMIEDIHNKYGNDVCLLTVDNGVSAFDAINKAKEYGFTIVVLDHHLAATEENGDVKIPNVDVLIDPAAFPDTADFDSYCGAGLSYKLATEFLGKGALKYLPLAMVATFADVMPLREENYVFVRDGLTYLNKGYAPVGLLELKEQNKLVNVTDQDIGFRIAPEINATGRLFDDGALKAIELMCADRFTAPAKALELIEINERRKEMVKLAEADIMPQISETDDIHIIYVPNINQGIVGIIAGAICEKTKRPAIVFTNSETGLLTGSARSVEAVHMKNMLDEVSYLLEHYGGHAGAAGLSIKPENLDIFTYEIKKTKNLDVDFAEKLLDFYDVEVPVNQLKDAITAMNRFAPFGEKNPQPVIKLTDFEATSFNGNTKKIIAGGGVRLSSRFGNAIGFGMADAMENYPNPKKLTFYGSPSFNYYQGKYTPQIMFTDFEVVV